MIDFDYTESRWAGNVELLRLRGGDLAARGAFLTLQDHGDPFWYRAIRLRTLGPDNQLERSQVTPQPVSEEALKREQEILKRILDGRQGSSPTDS